MACFRKLAEDVRSVARQSLTVQKTAVVRFLQNDGYATKNPAKRQLRLRLAAVDRHFHRLSLNVRAPQCTTGESGQHDSPWHASATVDLRRNDHCADRSFCVFGVRSIVLSDGLL